MIEYLCFLPQGSSMSTGLVFMNDAVIRQDLWVPVTIRIAWDLHMAKINMRLNVLQAARTHVFSYLDPDVSVDVAERLAGVYTADFIERIEHKKYQRPKWNPDIDLDFSVEWREQLIERLDSMAKRVFWLLYSDGLSQDKVAKRITKPIRVVENLIAAIRSEMRTLALERGVNLQEWSDSRMDQAIEYVARIATNMDIVPDEILTNKGKKYTRVCPRFRRAYYLMKNGVLAAHDLEIPEESQFVDRSKMLALLLNPQMRKYSSTISKSLEGLAISVDGEAWLIPEENVDDVRDILCYLAEESTPPRQHLRGAMVVGPGEWFDDVVLGPLPIRCLEAARSRPWESIDGIGELPLPLAPPPKATKWWLFAAISTLLSVSSLAWALEAKDPEVRYPVHADFYRSIQTVDVRFDVGELAYVTVVRLSNGLLSIEEQWDISGKGEIATGDGRYYLRVDAPQIAVISSATPLENLPSLLQAAQIAEDPLTALATHIRMQSAQNDVVISPSIQGR